ncbi:hypothetical protein [Sporomusa aerivorans]|uniref:hypothetical protein n=1 Tax=Sporomusa aerivorans TaxID=204936 RepID=UPI00352AAB8E
MGLGTSSASFIRNTLDIPQTTTLTGMSFSIRDHALGAGVVATAEIFVSTDCGVTPVASGIIVGITGPNPPNCHGFITASLVLAEGDLISVRVTTGGGAFANGAAATILFSVP